MTPPVIHQLVPMAHVAELARSIAFYAELGFVVDGRWEVDGRLVWVALASDEARLFLTLASAPVDATQQAVLFYLYTGDVAALRERLVAAGVAAGPVTHPPHMPAGEVRVSDPDGYLLLIGQDP